MNKRNWILGLLVCAIGLSACDASSRNSINDLFGRSSQVESASNTRGDIIERLVPEENASRQRTRYVIEATMRVTTLQRHELPDRPQRVRQILGGLSFDELARIEAILPEVERNPKLQWDD